MNAIINNTISQCVTTRNVTIGDTAVTIVRDEIEDNISSAYNRTNEDGSITGITLRKSLSSGRYETDALVSAQGAADYELHAEMKLQLETLDAECTPNTVDDEEV